MLKQIEIRKRCLFESDEYIVFIINFTIDIIVITNMIKTRSKPKIKPASNPIKKSVIQKPRIVSKDNKKAQEKENVLYPKFSTSALQSKKKLKASGEAET